MSRKLAEDTGIDERTMFDIVAERENLGSTGFGGGTALPHGRIPGLRHVKGVFAKLNKGIDFAACDNRPVDLVLCLFLRKQRRRPLKCVSANFQNHQRRGTLRKIREAAAGNDIYRLLTSD